jgi:hypothetical protein
MASTAPHGPHNPSGSTPGRPPSSVRRTSSMDTQWPHGLEGAVVIVGRARDLVTDQAGRATPVDTAELELGVDFHHGRSVTSIASTPHVNLEALVGSVAGPGFRRRMAEAAPDHRAGRTPLHLLLDDVPIAALLAAYAYNAAGRSSHQDLGLQVIVDQCAGWAGTSSMMDAVRETGRSPRVVGPAAPDLDGADDELGWHDLPPLPPMSIRRRRRMDVHRDGSDLVGNAMFRDSYLAEDGTQAVIHEYELRTRVDADLVVTEAMAIPKVLPWQECPAAAASARRIVGSPVAEMRGFVKESLFGTSTCTHLNDLLRSLDDVTSLQQYV